MSRYEVIVGNIGKVHEGMVGTVANQIFKDYVLKSILGAGRASGEDVSLWKDNEPIKEHVGKELESN